MRAIVFSFICLLVVSCGMYKSSFDCPPGEGIGCKPVSEVLDLIVEKESDTDLFVKDPEAALLLKTEEKKKKRRIASAQARTEEVKKLYLLKEHEKESVLVEAVGRS